MNPEPIRLNVTDGDDIRFLRLSGVERLSQNRVTQIVQDNQGFIVWQKDDSELLVVTGKVTVSLDDGLVLISLPVWCDQGTATLQVPFAVGGANSPAGMLVATEQHPRGPDGIILVWGEAVVAFAWQVLMSVLTRIASSTGKDQDGAGLIPAALTATADGVKILTMARHPFDRVTQ